MKAYILLCEVLSRIHTFFYSKVKGYRIGKGSVIFYKTFISSPSHSVSIGDNCTIGRTSYRYHGGMPFHTRLLNDGNDSFIQIGNNCRINGAYIHATKGITIGDNCVIASGVSIMDSNGHIVNSEDRTSGKDEGKTISIGNNVWIGMNVCILKGASIGDNCVIGAGCVISHDIPANSIVKQSGCCISPLNL